MADKKRRNCDPPTVAFVLAKGAHDKEQTAPYPASGGVVGGGVCFHIYILVCSRVYVALNVNRHPSRLFFVPSIGPVVAD